MNDMQLDLDVYRVQESQRGYSPLYFCEVIKTRFGWKNKSTGEVVWDKWEAIELITDEKKENKNDCNYIGK
jgi:Zn-finger protein